MCLYFAHNHACRHTDFVLGSLCPSASLISTPCPIAPADGCSDTYTNVDLNYDCTDCKQIAKDEQARLDVERLREYEVLVRDVERRSGFRGRSASETQSWAGVNGCGPAETGGDGQRRPSMPIDIPGKKVRE